MDAFHNASSGVEADEKAEEKAVTFRSFDGGGCLESVERSVVMLRFMS